MHKLAVFIPISHKETVKAAMFDAGGGRIGHYDCCSFETEGTGQFRPLAGSNPHIGTKGEVETLKEVRVEMVVADDVVSQVIGAMKHEHPYETVAYDLIKLENKEEK